MEKSLLRGNETVDGSDSPCPDGGTAYLMILNAVEQQDGLYHGKLDGPRGEHCAIGSFFAVNKKTALPSKLVDEVAMVNDSMPACNGKQRKRKVLQWLRWRLAELGVPGYRKRG